MIPDVVRACMHVKNVLNNNTRYGPGKPLDSRFNLYGLLDLTEHIEMVTRKPVLERCFWDLTIGQWTVMCQF